MIFLKFQNFDRQTPAPWHVLCKNLIFFSARESCQGTEHSFWYYVLSELSLKKVPKHDWSRMEKSSEWCEVVVKNLLSSFLCGIETDGAKNKSSNISGRSNSNFQ